MKSRKRKYGSSVKRRGEWGLPPIIYDQRLHHPWQKVYTFLNVKDLGILACVSKKFYGDIEYFCKLLCCKYSLRSSLHQFFQKNLLLLDDEDIKKEVQRTTYKYCWLYTTWKKLYRVRRASVTNFVMDNLGEV